MKEIMKGHPVPPENRIPHQDWDRAPWNRWSFQNVREIVPTTEVWQGNGPTWELPIQPAELENVEFPSENSQSITIGQWLDSSYTDGFLVTHRGAIVYERYMNGMGEHSLHLSQSMAKSVTGAVAGILRGRGLLDANQQVTHYLPALKHTGWNGALLQHVMDMTTGVRYIEDYEALDSDIAMTDIASGWKRPLPGVESPACIWDQIMSLTETTRNHGDWFEYRSIETDVLAHCMESVTQTRLADLVSQELWQPLGCEQSANFTVDPAGYSLACGGLSASLRDYARFGQMLLCNGQANGQQVVPSAWINDIYNTRPEIFPESYKLATPNGAYRNQFWIEDVNRKAFMAPGCIWSNHLYRPGLRYGCSEIIKLARIYFSAKIKNHPCSDSSVGTSSARQLNPGLRNL